LLHNIKKYLLIVTILFYPSYLFSQSIDRVLPFSVGERIKYYIYASGFLVGYQTIELGSTVRNDHQEVYKLEGLTKTSPFVSLIYRLDDKWTVFIEKDKLFPIMVEKDIVEGKKSGYLIYYIDQNKNIVKIYNRETEKTKVVNAKNTVFDLFSLIYYFRGNPNIFKNTFTFDFLEEKSVQTVHFKDAGEVKIRIPKVSRKKLIPARRYVQVGGIGIEIFVGADSLRLPLKMIVPSRLPKNKSIKIVFVIGKYAPGIEQEGFNGLYEKIRY